MRTAVVTGAGSGIGREITRALLSEGYHVALAGRRSAALAETAGNSEAALVRPTDIADPASVESLFEAVRERWGRLDLLVNNAGINIGGTVDELSVDNWRRVVDTALPTPDDIVAENLGPPVPVLQIYRVPPHAMIILVSGP